MPSKSSAQAAEPPAESSTPADGTETAPDGAQPADDAQPDGANAAEGDGVPGPVPDGAAPGGPAAPGAATPDAPASTPAAAPLTPPAARPVPVPPINVAATPGTVIPQETEGHEGIVDEAGELLPHDTLFTDPGAHHTWLEAARDIYRKFRYPGQLRETSGRSMQLVCRRGARLPRHEAHALIEQARQGGQDGEG